MLVVHNTRGMDAFLLIPEQCTTLLAKRCFSHTYYACWPSVLVVGSSGSCKLVVMYIYANTWVRMALLVLRAPTQWRAYVRTSHGMRVRTCIGRRMHAIA